MEITKIYTNHPVTITGPHNGEMLEVIDYVLTNKFQLTRGVKFVFEPTEKVKIGITSTAPACYHEKKSQISVAVNTPSQLMLNAIAHELKHHEQSQRNAIPDRKRNNPNSSYEREAAKFAREVLDELEEIKKQNGTYQERHILHRYEFSQP